MQISDDLILGASLFIFVCGFVAGAITMITIFRNNNKNGHHHKVDHT